MAGSRGSGPSRSIRNTLKDEAERQAAEARLRTEVLSVINELLSAINNRDIDIVNSHLKDIEEALGDRVEEFDTLLYGGSVAKHTYVDGVSDVDSLVVLDFDPSEHTPDEFLSEFRSILEAKLNMGKISDISTGRMAVTIGYKDGTEIQLLPAARSGDTLSIATSDGRAWNEIAPKRFSERLKEVNKNCGRIVVPTIKLAKSALQQLPEHAQLSGYHVEALAVEAFKNYTGPRNSDAALRYFFRSASEAVRTPAPDTTGQSLHVDEHLGPAGSPDRRRIANTLASVADRLDKAESAAVWRRVIAGE